VVEATTLLLENVLADSSNTRFTLLSGSRYPIVSNEEIAAVSTDQCQSSRNKMTPLNCQTIKAVREVA